MLETAPPTAPPPGDDGVNDPEGWVDRHGDALYRYAFARVNDAAAAEDLVQETLLAAWRGRRGFDGRSSLRTWMIGILKARVADHYRRVGRDRTASTGPLDADQPVAEFDRHGSWTSSPAAWRSGAVRTAIAATSERSAPEQRAEHAEFWDILSRCAGDLPQHLGRVLQSRAFNNDSTDEICRSEGITSKNLSVRLHRARLLLRRCLEEKWFCADPRN